MNAASYLSLMDIPVWIERPLDAPRHAFVVVAEKQAAFSPAHQQQLQKILDYLKFPHRIHPLYQDSSPLTLSPEFIICFGPASSLPANVPTCITHSISEMLTQPSCKRTVLHDLQTFKNAIA